MINTNKFHKEVKEILESKGELLKGQRFADLDDYKKELYGSDFESREVIASLDSENWGGYCDKFCMLSLMKLERGGKQVFAVTNIDFFDGECRFSVHETLSPSVLKQKLKPFEEVAKESYHQENNLYYGDGLMARLFLASRLVHVL